MTRLKILRYLAMLLQYHDAIGVSGRNGAKIPKREILISRLKDYPEALVDSVRRRFSTEGTNVSKWTSDNLLTHICALALHIDGFNVDISTLKDDLKMEQRQLITYFQELGCKIAAMTEGERAAKGLTKSAALDCAPHGVHGRWTY